MNGDHACLGTEASRSERIAKARDELMTTLREQDIWRFLPCQEWPTEDAITEGWPVGWETRPRRVSIVCALHDHEELLRDALCGFVLQQGTAPFEVLLHDDASTDGTAVIARAFAERYPRLVHLKVQHENQFAHGRNVLDWAVDHLQGDYVAFCEGDDFWIDRNKLARQLQALERYPDASLCVACTRELDARDGSVGPILGIHRQGPPVVLSVDHAVNTYWHYSTFVIRRDVLLAWRTFAMSARPLRLGDTFLRHFAAARGTVVACGEVMSVYRTTGAGIWTSLTRAQRFEWNLKASLYLGQHLGGAIGTMNRRDWVPRLIVALARAHADEHESRQGDSPRRSVRRAGRVAREAVRIGRRHAPGALPRVTLLALRELRLHCARWLRRVVSSALHRHRRGSRRELDG